jgi:hypothetical protein
MACDAVAAVLSNQGGSAVVVGSAAMKSYVAAENIHRFTEMLSAEPSAERRAVLQRLLEEEQERLQQMQAEQSDDTPFNGDMR